MKPWVGRYPFDIYGSFVVDADHWLRPGDPVPVDLRPLLVPRNPAGGGDPTMLHELAHQWFGDSVAPLEWSDLWINEGHASWYEFLYAEENGWLDEDTENWPDPTGYATLEELMRAIYAHGDQWRFDVGPVALPVGRKRSSPSRATTVARWSCTRCGRRSETTRSSAWSGLGPPLPRRVGRHGGLHRTRLAGRGDRPERVPRRTGSTAPRPRRCPAIPIGRSTPVGVPAPLSLKARRTRARGAPPLTEESARVRAASRRARPARTSSRCCAASRHAARGRTRRPRLGPSPSRSRGESLRAPSPRRRSG